MDDAAKGERHLSTAPDNGRESRFPLALMHAAATLYYLREETQADVARSLGVSRATVSRLLAEARRLGIVRIEVVDPADAADPQLPARLASHLDLDRVYVARSAHDAVRHRAIAAEVAQALQDVALAPGEVLLVSSGRTVWEVGQEPLPRFPGVVVTPMVGGQDEPEAWYQTNEITRTYAEKLGGRPVFLWAPALPGPGLHERLLQDSRTDEVLALWRQARCALLGVGAPPASRASLPDFVPREAPWLLDAAGDICTRFFDAQGEELSHPGSDRLVATTRDTLRSIPHSIAVASGVEKVPSLLAAARAGWFNTLVTDATTASALLHQD